MLRALVCLLAMLTLSACVSEPKDPSFIGARAFDAEEAAKTRVSLGLTYLKNGNFSQAKFNLDKALEFAPRNGQAHFAMAFYYQQVDEAELAGDSYEKALAFSRNDPDIVNSYGAFLCREGKYEKAKEYFLKAVNSKNYVSTAETYENLAICSQNQGKNQEAIEFFTNALNHQPTRPQSLYLLTRLYIEERQWDAAKRTLFKYERNAQVSAETLYMQFQIAQGMDDKKTAVGYGEILKSMFPEHSNTQAYLAQMGKFKPSAMVTRKIRDKASPEAADTIDAQLLADVLSESEAAPQAMPRAMQSGSTSLGFDVSNESSVIIIDTTKPEISSSSDSIKSIESAVEDGQPTMINTQDKVDDVLVADDVDEVALPEMTDTGSQLNTEDALAAALQDEINIAPTEVLAQSNETSEDEFHVVQAQENLYRISLKYNVKMSALLEWNNLTDSSSIRVGSKLRVRDPNNNE